MSTGDTIFAFGTGEGVTAIAVLRISGERCKQIAELVFGRVLTERRAELVKFRDPVTNETLDTGLALWFSNPASFTGEDCLEFHCHGSLAVKASIIAALQQVEGCRLAEPGEFTRRAFLNGKMDLTAVEALGDLLQAKTRNQQFQALGLLGGRFSERAMKWRSLILQAIARLDSVIDFADEGDVDSAYIQEVTVIKEALVDEIARALKNAKGGEIVREGFKVVLCGAVNAGKSSLLNALAKRDVAIVSDVPGTTRDLVEVALDLDGSLVRVIDSAGVRQTSDIIENTGIARGLEAARTADLVLWLYEVGANAEIDPRVADCGSEVVAIATKQDLSPGLQDRECRIDGSALLEISTKSGFGIDELELFLSNRVTNQVGGVESGLVVRARHRSLLEGCCVHLRQAVSIEGLEDLEIAAEEFRMAGHCIGQITGHIDVEEVLGEIFSRFCIGK